MPFADFRIKNDLENLTMPIKYTLEGRTVYFELRIDSPVYNGLYRFRLDIPEEYPFKSPKLKCLSRVYHPNIDGDGNVCLMVLREGWMPAYDINSVVVSLIWVFDELSGENALNVEAGDLCSQNYDEFVRRAREYENCAAGEQNPL